MTNTMTTWLQTTRFKSRTHNGIFTFIKNDDMGNEIFKASGPHQGDKISITEYTYMGNVIKDVDIETFTVNLGEDEIAHPTELFNEFVEKMNDFCNHMGLRLWSY
tara:strand:+ start:607 stop:921 length:315 start_codon:yes stop_codon:yes gene_type:complete